MKGNDASAYVHAHRYLSVLFWLMLLLCWAMLVQECHMQVQGRKGSRASVCKRVEMCWCKGVARKCEVQPRLDDVYCV